MSLDRRSLSTASSLVHAKHSCRACRQPCTASWIQSEHWSYDQCSDWIQLAVHGWRHARHECLAWTSEEAVDKLRRSSDIYPAFAHIFKAPNWEIESETYAGCKQA